MPYLEPATPGRSSCSSVSNGRTLIGDAEYFPCGPVNETTTAVPCCRRSHTCIAGGLCSYVKAPKKEAKREVKKEGDETEDEDEDEKDPAVTSYYASGCTDPAFANPACSRICVNLVAGDVVYNGTGWQCCANHRDVDCSKPSSAETIFLPPPRDLKPYFQIPATGLALTSATAPTQTLTSSLVASWVPEPTQAAPSGAPPLSHGAAAGLGVGVTSSVALIAWAVWFLARRARAKRVKPAESPGDGGGHDEIANPFATPTTRHNELESPVTEKPLVEMTSHPYLAPELPGSVALYELSAEPPSGVGSTPPVSPLSPVKE